MRFERSRWLLLGWCVLALGCGTAMAQQPPDARQQPDSQQQPDQKPDEPKKPFRRLLISNDRGFIFDPNDPYRRDLANMVSRYIAPGCPHPWSVRKYRYFGGKQEQVDIIWIDNGKLKIGVLPTRGMGIFEVIENGQRVLGWTSPVKEIVNPRFVNLQNRGGLGWLEGFNEWFCRGGMEWNGQRGTDRFLDNQGEETSLDLTLNGRIANLPAQEVLLIAEREPPYRITLRAVVHERAVGGPNLELTTELSIEPNARTFRITDAVTNRGSQRQEFQMLYHTNFGTPLLEAGAKFLAPVETVTPFNEHAAKSVATYDQLEGPTPGFVEQTYCLQPLTDRAGNTLAIIHNKDASRGAAVRFNTRELPYLTLWKNTAAREDGYVVGIEPGTNYPNNRRIERIHGRVPTLSPGESRFMTLDFSVLEGANEVEQAVSEVKKIQGDRRPLLDDKPQKKE